MYNYLFTIIVPCYNIGQNAEKLTKMLVNKKYTNYEVIFIDDCSKDDTCGLLSLHCKAYRNFKVFKTTVNGGPGAARNLGLERATGEYIIFCDSDDFFDIRCLGNLDEFIKARKDADWIVAPYKLMRRDKELLVDDYTSVESDRVSKVSYILKGNCAPWCKVYKLSIIRANQLKFPDRMTAEDICFVVSYARYVTICYKFNAIFYEYIMNDSSLTHTDNVNMDTKTTFEVLNDIYKENFPEIEVEKFVNDHLLTMAKRMYSQNVSNRHMEEWFCKENERYPGWIYKIDFFKQPIYRKLIYLAMYWNISILIKFIMRVRNRLY
mgnify:CR=1 FL=1